LPLLQHTHKVDEKKRKKKKEKKKKPTYLVVGYFYGFLVVFVAKHMECS
jgi:hypothetical protein